MKLHKCALSGTRMYLLSLRVIPTTVRCSDYDSVCTIVLLRVTCYSGVENDNISGTHFPRYVCRMVVGGVWCMRPVLCLFWADNFLGHENQMQLSENTQTDYYNRVENKSYAVWYGDKFYTR